jgi:hypothetical protein
MMMSSFGERGKDWEREIYMYWVLTQKGLEKDKELGKSYSTTSKEYANKRKRGKKQEIDQREGDRGCVCEREEENESGGRESARGVSEGVKRKRERERAQGVRGESRERERERETAREVGEGVRERERVEGANNVLRVWGGEKMDARSTLSSFTRTRAVAAPLL